MFVTKILDEKNSDDYSTHQKIKEIFPGDQKVLFQRLGGFITIVSEKAPQSIKTKEINKFEEEQFLFSILLNPVKDRNGQPKKIPSENIRQWVIEKLEGAGVSIISETLNCETGTRVSKKGGLLITLYSVFVTGVLNVVDKNKFLIACQNGIGHGKGLGFGLLNVF
jgi:CRISPR-associated protein Cas6/Cse3/CasE subtype I-E